MASRETVYSFSRLKGFEQCPYQYKRRYIDHDMPRRRTIEAFLGTTVHSVVEDHHKGNLESKKVALWEAFHERWDQTYNEGAVFDPRGRGVEWWQQHGLRCLGHYLTCGQVSVEHEVLGIESRYKTQLVLAPPIKIQGILDRIVRTDTGAIEIHDFKTGKKPQRRWFEQDHQLPLYAQLVEPSFMLEPEDSIRTVRIYLATGEPEEFWVTRERRLEAWHWAQKTALLAHEFEKAVREGRIEAEPRLAVLCDWCPLKARRCPAHSVKDVM